MVAGPVPRQEVDDLERATGFALSADYKTFVERFGGAIVGAFSVLGLRASQAMGKDEASALTATQRFRKQKWPGTQNWLVISSDHAGNPLGLDKQGRVFIYDHDVGAIEKIADTFEEFLRSWCLKLP